MHCYAATLCVGAVYALCYAFGKLSRALCLNTSAILRLQRCCRATSEPCCAFGDPRALKNFEEFWRTRVSHPLKNFGFFWEIQRMWNSRSRSQSQSFGAAIASRAESTSLLSLQKLSKEKSSKAQNQNHWNLFNTVQNQVKLQKRNFYVLSADLWSVNTPWRYLQPSHFSGNWWLRILTFS